MDIDEASPQIDHLQKQKVPADSIYSLLTPDWAPAEEGDKHMTESPLRTIIQYDKTNQCETKVARNKNWGGGPKTKPNKT